MGTSPVLGTGLPLLLLLSALILVTIPASSSDLGAASSPPIAQPANNETAPPELGQFDVLLLTEDSPQSLLVLSTGSSSSSSSVSKRLVLPPLATPTTTASGVVISRRSDTYESVSVSPSSTTTNTVFFSTSMGELGYWNLTSNTTALLYSGGTTTDLVFFNDSLFWIEDHNTLKTGQVQNSTLSNPTTLFSSDSAKVHDLAVDPASGLLLYALWPVSSRSNGSIWTMNTTTSESKLLISELHLPRSVYSDGEHVYWANNPPGIYFTIERAPLSNPSGARKTILRQTHPHAGSLAVSCGRLYWTGVDDKRLFVVDEPVSMSSRRQASKTVPAVTGESVKAVFAPFKPQCSAHAGVKVLPAQVKATLTQKNGDTPRATTFNPLPTTTTAAYPSTTFSSSEALSSASSSSSESQETTVRHQPLRLCSHEEAAAIGCDGVVETTRVCVVFLHNPPVCLSPGEGHVEPPSWPPEVIAVISVLSTLAVVMTLISLYMCVRVRNLSKKPIIRRRVVVSRRTSESSASPAICEMIDIENCCNMNVCETPCYERTLLQPVPGQQAPQQQQQNVPNTLISVNSTNETWPSSNNKNTKEDKRCLLSI